MLIMKTLMQSLIILLHCVIGSHYVLGGSINCMAIGGEVPIPIPNSPYTLLPNGSLCCPEYVGNYCLDEKEMAPKCSGGLVPEPCHFCKTCAKQAGETCGGHQNLHGTCDEGLECVDHNNTNGICYGKADKQVGDVCGGSHGIKGRCSHGLRCNISEDRFLEGENVQGVCLNASTAPGACFKSCVNRSHSRTCGNDGRWYINKCELRKQNCIIPLGRQPEKIKSDVDSVCDQACEEVDLSNYEYAKVSSYSLGLVSGSNATIVCEEGYGLPRDKENITVRCKDRRWYNVITKEDESEILRENWTVLCYPSQSENSDTASD